MRPYEGFSGHHFASFRLDHVNQCLWRASEQIALSPKAFCVLLYLVERSGKLATKQELLDAIWPDVHVTEGVLKRAILEIRKALADPIEEPLFIQTLHRRGYRFIAPVNETASAELVQREPASAGGPELIGREREFRQLDAWFHEALAGSRQIVFLAGESGLGKTALLAHWTRSIAGNRGAVIGRGQCVQHLGNAEPYLPIFEAVEQLARVLRRRLTEALHTYAPTWLLQLPSLMSPDDRRRLREEMGDSTRQPLLREIVDALEALSQASPVVLALEDLQWSDPSTIALLSALARRTGSARLMVLATLRTAQTAKNGLQAAKNELELHRQCRELSLRPFTEEETVEYVEARFPGMNSAEVANALHLRTAGNLMYLQCVVDELSRSGRMESDPAVIRQTVPDALQLLFKRQAAELDREEQRVLDVAAVAGESFSASVVAAALGWKQAEAEEVCDGIVHREVMLKRCPDLGYAFLHGLLRDSLYRRIEPVRRSHLHRAMAKPIDTRQPGTVTSFLYCQASAAA